MKKYESPKLEAIELKANANLMAVSEGGIGKDPNPVDY